MKSKEKEEASNVDNVLTSTITPSNTTLAFSHFEDLFDQKKKIFFNLTQISFLNSSLINMRCLWNTPLSRKTKALEEGEKTLKQRD